MRPIAPVGPNRNSWSIADSFDSEEQPSRRRRIRQRAPSINLGIGPAGPSATFGPSAARQDQTVLRALFIDLSKRAVLYEGIQLEVESEALSSVHGMLSEVVTARKALSQGSFWDPPLKRLQSACLLYRRQMREQIWPFGERLLHLRAAALQLADAVAEQTDLPEARQLADLIDLGSAVHPMGESRTIYVEPGLDPIPPDNTG